MRNKRKELRQKEQVLISIINYFIVHGYAPSLREICDATGIVSASTVSYHLDVLKKEGKIESEAGLGSPRAFRVKGMRVVFEDPSVAHTEG